MNIQPIQNYNVSMQGKPNPNGGWKFLRKSEQKILNIFPEKKKTNIVFQNLNKEYLNLFIIILLFIIVIRRNYIY